MNEGCELTRSRPSGAWTRSAEDQSMKDVFEEWVRGFLKRKFPSIVPGDGSDAWPNEVLRRYYAFGESFELRDTRAELYSRAIFALWFSGGRNDQRNCLENC